MKDSILPHQIKEHSYIDSGHLVTARKKPTGLTPSSDVQAAVRLILWNWVLTPQKGGSDGLHSNGLLAMASVPLNRFRTCPPAGVICQARRSGALHSSGPGELDLAAARRQRTSTPFAPRARVHRLRGSPLALDVLHSFHEGFCLQTCEEC